MIQSCYNEDDFELYYDYILIGSFRCKR